MAKLRDKIEGNIRMSLNDTSLPGVRPVAGAGVGVAHRTPAGVVPPAGHLQQPAATDTQRGHGVGIINPADSANQVAKQLDSKSNFLAAQAGQGTDANDAAMLEMQKASETLGYVMEAFKTRQTAAQFVKRGLSESIRGWLS